MLTRTQLAELPPRPGASPGLMRRRYSMPETIMRKYRLAQQRSDSEESVAATAPSRAASPASASPPRGSCASLNESQHRFQKRDRELMRKSALLRRLWARPNCNPCPACCYCSDRDLYDSQVDCGRETKSLDSSRAELRPLSGSFTSSRLSKESHTQAGWATPKRQRLESPNYLNGSEEMHRLAMRNSYDKAEELRQERETKPEELSDSTFQSHEHRISSYVATSSDTPFTNSPEISSNGKTTENNRNIIDINISSEPVTALVLSETCETPNSNENKQREVNNKLVELHFKENVSPGKNSESNVTPYKPANELPFEILEIIVSETVDSKTVEVAPSIKLASPGNDCKNISKILNNYNRVNNTIDFDEYVSNILVESLNSLTDQLESMNASIGTDHRISIVEKEIKVKLQNTGVNTIVHLSPTSNNQIIFGNEELCNNDENKDMCNNIQINELIRDEVHSTESNNNSVSADTELNKVGYVEDIVSIKDDSENINHENVNTTVLQQIQRLFQEGFDNYDAQMNYSSTIPEISHIEISNVDVFINENLESLFESNDNTKLEINIPSVTDSIPNKKPEKVLSSVGTGSYYKATDGAIFVPRFSAFPNTDSMEVNTSSSDDPELIESDCTSFVDSLDDPNSPRSAITKKSNKRNELVRSAIDVLDLLPENGLKEEPHLKEKSESFFIRIKDNDCDCQKENIVVADHMPEIIKERLHRRHRKREMRMECARRKKVKQIKREIEKNRHNEIIKSKKHIEKDCMTIIDALIDEVISKITQDEYKYMRIKQTSKNEVEKRTEGMTYSSCKRGSCKLTYKVDESLVDIASYKNDNNLKIQKTRKSDFNKTKSSLKHIHGKLSLPTRSIVNTNNCTPKRFYQKSEIHEGNKCIEILEILEYVDPLQSSPETSNSDETQNYSDIGNKFKKSKIPIPIYERLQKHIKPKTNNCTDHNSNEKPNVKVDHYIASMLMDALNDDINELNASSKQKEKQLLTSELPIRRASVPQQEISRSRNSRKFKQMFDIIPEERSSLSVESSNEDINYNRRVSAPVLTIEQNQNNNVKIHENKAEAASTTHRDVRNVATSPLNDNNEKVKTKSVTTSPLRRSAATSPLLNIMEKNDKSCGTSNNSAKKSLSSHGTRAGWLGFYKPNKQVLDEEGITISCTPCH